MTGPVGQERAVDYYFFWRVTGSYRGVLSRRAM